MKPSQTRYTEYLQSDYWKKVTEAVKRKASYRCQICNSQHDLQVHHRTYDHRGRELEFLDDLICLCRRCHGTFHGKLEQAPASARPGNKFIKEKVGYRVGDPAEHAKLVEADMPPDECVWIELNDELIRKLRTPTDAFTNATLRALGMTAPLMRGWPHRLKGMKIHRNDFRRALEGRYIYNTGKLERAEAPQ